jgi:hypothetical protein
MNTRLIPVLLIGSLMMGSAFAASETTSKAAGVLTTEQITAIQKECARENGDSMTSKAYQTCVKEKEDAAVAKAANHRN